MIGKFVLGALAALGFSTAVLAQDATPATPASP
jgi:hypothetical protein